MRDNIVLRYTLFGALFGLLFPIVSSLILIYQSQLPLTLGSLVHIQKSNPLQWIINTAPFFLGLFAYLAGRRQDQILQLMGGANRAVFENMPDGILVLDSENRVLDLNATAQEFIGLSKEQVEDWPVDSLIPDWLERMGDPAQASPRWETVIGDGSQARTYDLQISPLLGPRGRASHIVVLRDISELKQRTTELSTLLEATHAVSSTLVLEETLSRIVEQMARVLNADACTLSRWDKESDAVVTWIQEWYRDISGGEHAGSVYPLVDYPATRSVLEKRQPLCINISAPDADPAEVALMAEQGIQSLLMLPLAVGERVFGLVELSNEAHEYDYSEAEIQLAQALADQAAIAIENARLYMQAQANLEELENIQRQYLARAWTDALSTVGSLDYTYQGAPSPDQPARGEGDGAQSTLQVPIRLRNQVIGSLTLEADSLEGDAARDWTPEEMAFIEAITDQAALALESARLLDEAQRLAQREQQINLIASQVRGSVNLDTIMQNTIRELGRALGAARTYIQIGGELQATDPPTTRVGSRLTGNGGGSSSRAVDQNDGPGSAQKSEDSPGAGVDNS